MNAHEKGLVPSICRIFCGRRASHTTILTWYYCASLSPDPCAPAFSNHEAAAADHGTLLREIYFRAFRYLVAASWAAGYQIGDAPDCQAAAQRGCHGFPLDGADMSDRICVLAWPQPGAMEVSRGEKLHACDDARLMASELIASGHVSTSGQLRRLRENWHPTPLTQHVCARRSLRPLNASICRDCRPISPVVPAWRADFPRRARRSQFSRKSRSHLQGN